MILYILLILLLIYLFNINTKEPYNDSSGKLCLSCNDKTFNQCLECFNCGFCVDKWGNSKCIVGDMHGPYNYEQCDRWYYNDPWTYVTQQNAKNSGCGNGPRQENRII